jgi:hypothetical protein
MRLSSSIFSLGIFSAIFSAMGVSFLHCVVIVLMVICFGFVLGGETQKINV